MIYSDPQFNFPDVVSCHRCRTTILHVAPNMIEHYPGIVICPTCGTVLQYKYDIIENFNDRVENDPKYRYDTILKHYKTPMQQFGYSLLNFSDAVKQQIDMSAFMVLDVIESVLAPIEAGFIRVGGRPLTVDYSLLLMTMVGDTAQFEITFSPTLENDSRCVQTKYAMYITVPLNASPDTMHVDGIKEQIKKELFTRILAEMLDSSMHRMQLGTFSD